MTRNSIAKTEAEQKLTELCDSVLNPKGFRVVDLDCSLSLKSLIRLFVDKVDSEKGPSLDEVADASRLVDPLIEAANITAGAYDLEVSSPGLDRRLRLKTDFENVVGTEISLNLLESYPGLGANVKGDLVRVDQDQLVIGQGKKNRKEFSIPLANIKRANRVWQFEAKGMK